MNIGFLKLNLNRQEKEVAISLEKKSVVGAFCMIQKFKSDQL